MRAHADKPEKDSDKDAWDRLPVSSIMNRDFVCVHADLSIEVLTGLFLERGWLGAPVLDHNEQLVGYVSMVDLLRRYENGTSEDEVTLDVPMQQGGAYSLGAGFHPAEIASATVRDVMTPLCVAVPSTASVRSVAAMMVGDGLWQVPVVSARGKIVGVVAAGDVIRWLATAHGTPRRRRAPTAAATPAPAAKERHGKNGHSRTGDTTQCR